MFTLNCKGRIVVIDQPIVMGIINITPDSFYTGSRHMEEHDLLQQADKMINDGAAILDLGGQSSRPGSTPLSAREELDRVLPAITVIHKHFPDILVSVDTWFAEVAAEAVSAGASIVNDISGGLLDEDMIETVARLKVPYVCMHMPGRPQTMHLNPTYKNVVTDVLDFFIRQISVLQSAGIHDIIVDPGFGFGKTIAHNFELLNGLDSFKMLQKPILAGLSRKSTVYKTLGTQAEHALNGTTVMNTISLLKGASILRVHDVKEAVEAIKLVSAYNKHKPIALKNS